jgi:hypothetical protein
MNHGSDICYCGDYRSQHKENGPCKVCRGVWFDMCDKFQFSRKANVDDKKHWDKFHSRKRQAKDGAK